MSFTFASLESRPPAMRVTSAAISAQGREPYKSTRMSFFFSRSSRNTFSL